MKTIIIMLSLMSFNANALDAAGSLKKLETTPTKKTFTETQKKFALEFTKTTKEKLTILLDKDETLFAAMSVVLFPEYNPDAIENKKAYLACYEQLYLLKKELGNKKLFKSYQTCLNYNYGNHLPKHYSTVLNVLKNVK